MRPPARGIRAVPLPTGTEAAAFDHEAISRVGIAGSTLMESAGRSAAELAAHLAPEGPIVVLVGGGNNGGDALVTARSLVAWGREVEVIVAADRSSGDSLLHGWPLPVLRDDVLDDARLQATLASAALVVDGLLGIGARGAPRPRIARLIVAANDAARPILSLDIASGVDADTGAVAGAAVRASLTLAFGWPKLGSLLAPGRQFTGRLLAAEIGFPPPPAATPWARLLTPAWAATVRPRRQSDTHKNRVGALLLVAGGEGMAGAAVLAGRAAQRSGTGYLRVATAAANREVLQTSLPDAPWCDAADPAALHRALEASDAVALGPGLGTDDDARRVLEQVLDLMSGAADRTARAMVLDADALTLIAAGAAGGAAGLGAGRTLVLTPHPGEAARLLGCSTDEVQADRPAAARRLAALTQAVVVLKGMPSLVAAPDGPLAVSGVTSSDLAVAGMGDVLTGSIGAFLAQGAAPADAAGLALVAGALAARATGLGPGVAASDVPERLAHTLAALVATDPAGVVASDRTRPAAPDSTRPAASALPFAWLTLDLDAPS